MVVCVLLWGFGECGGAGGDESEVPGETGGGEGYKGGDAGGEGVECADGLGEVEWEDKIVVEGGKGGWV